MLNIDMESDVCLVAIAVFKTVVGSHCGPWQVRFLPSPPMIARNVCRSESQKGGEDRETREDRKTDFFVSRLRLSFKTLPKGAEASFASVSKVSEC